jgi:hypothetical protein
MKWAAAQGFKVIPNPEGKKTFFDLWIEKFVTLKPQPKGKEEAKAAPQSEKVETLSVTTSGKSLEEKSDNHSSDTESEENSDCSSVSSEELISTEILAPKARMETPKGVLVERYIEPLNDMSYVETFHQRKGEDSSYEELKPSIQKERAPESQEKTKGTLVERWYHPPYMESYDSNATAFAEDTHTEECVNNLGPAPPKLGTARKPPAVRILQSKFSGIEPNGSCNALRLPSGRCNSIGVRRGKFRIHLRPFSSGYSTD